MVEGEPRVDGAMPVGAAVVAIRVWRFRGQLQVTVVTKATFAFAPEAQMIRVAPREIFRAEVHHGNSPGRSIRFSTDLAPYLPRAEVFFTGRAYAPSSSATEIVPVRLGIFDGSRIVFAKSVLVRPSGGALEVPLVYERAYGGVGWAENVVGTGVAEGSDEPSILDPSDPKRIAGFGPIGQYWPARRKLLGPQHGKALKLPIAAIPDDFDWSYFQAAPLDQRIDFLRGDEWIVMDGLHPSLPRVRTRLPGARGLARVHGLAAFGIAEGQPLMLHADTLRIDGDDLQCSLTFRGTFPLPSEEALHGLRVVAGVELRGDPIVWPEPPALTSGAPARASEWTNDADIPSFDGTLMLEEDVEEEAPAPKPSLPVRAPAAPQVTVTRGRPPPLKRRAIEPRTGPLGAGAAPLFERTMSDEDQPRRPRTLPFRADFDRISALATPDASPARARDHSLTGTMAEEPDEEVRAAQRAVLPFGQKAPAVAAPPPASVKAQAEVEEATLEVAPRPAPPPAPPPPATPPQRAEKPSGSPWAPPPPPPPPPPPAPRAPPPPPPAQLAASAALKKGLYGKFGGNR